MKSKGGKLETVLGFASFHFAKEESQAGTQLQKSNLEVMLPLERKSFWEGASD